MPRYVPGSMLRRKEQTPATPSSPPEPEITVAPPPPPAPEPRPEPPPPAPPLAPAEPFAGWTLDEHYTPPSAAQTVKWWSDAAKAVRREQLKHVPITLPEGITSSPEWAVTPPDGFARRVSAKAALGWIVSRERNLADEDICTAADRHAKLTGDVYRRQAEREAAVRFRVVIASGETVPLDEVAVWIAGRTHCLTTRASPPGSGFTVGPASLRLQAEAEAEAVYTVFERADPKPL